MGFKSLTQSNLSYCQDTSINIYVKAELSDETKYSYEKLKSLGYDIFNLNDPFYQDICIDYTSYGNTDMSLSDRINYIYNNDDTRCQPNCKATKFSPESEYLNCSCNINEEVNNMKQKFKPKKIYESFYDVLKYSNYKILKCYNLVFTEFLMTKNKGGIIVFIFILINLGCLILFIIKRINPLKNKLKLKIENQINNNNDINNMNNNDINNMNNNDLNNMNSNDINNMNSNDLNFMNNKDIIINNKVDINKMNIDGFIISRKMDIYKGSSKLLKKDNPPKRRSFIQTHKLNKDISDTNTINNLNKESLAKKINVKKIKIIRRNSSRRFSLNLDGKTSLWDNSINRINNLAIPKPKEKINPQNTEGNKKENEKKVEEKLDNFELNELNFYEAINLDKRTFIQIYWSLLRREHPILFTFFVYDDYNLIYIKIVRFIFLITTDMVMNVFFFSDESMHKLYVDNGKYDFIQQIPQIIYSIIVSRLFEIFICYLSLTDKPIYQIKYLMLHNLQAKMRFIFRCINIKFIIFFTFTFVFILFYWYIVAAFCSVYKNTQIAFIKDWIFSFLLDMLIPFVLYLIPASLRICAIRSRNCKGSVYIYKLSNIIPIF